MRLILFSARTRSVRNWGWVRTCSIVLSMCARPLWNFHSCTIAQLTWLTDSLALFRPTTSNSCSSAEHVWSCSSTWSRLTAPQWNSLREHARNDRSRNMTSGDTPHTRPIRIRSSGFCTSAGILSLLKQKMLMSNIKTLWNTCQLCTYCYYANILI